MTAPMPKDNEVDEKVMPEPLTYGMRRKGEMAVIGLIPPKVHANPPKVPEYLRDYEEVPLYSAATVAELRAEVERLRAALHIETHKVITCGVAAVHPDASLSRRMEYAGKWNSPQAQHVRVLRDRADAAERRVGELEAFVTAVRTECFDYYNEGIRPWPHHMRTIAWKADEVLEHATLTGADPT